MKEIDRILQQLHELAVKMGGKPRVLMMNSNTEIQPIDALYEKMRTREGIQIELENIESRNGLFFYQGHHVLLFIPDHGWNFDKKIRGDIEGNKYHLTDCKTLEDMRSKNRYNRYHVTNNTEGIFHIFGKNEYGEDCQGEVELYVCKNCLMKLDYQNYSKNRSVVYDRFNLKEFFQTYSTSFTSKPESLGQDKAGYADDWKEISRHVRENNGWRCDQCRVDLSKHQRLLQVHHIDGVKQHNERKNLKVLCVECHSKEPNHGHMRISNNDYSLLWRLRREQGLR